MPALPLDDPFSTSHLPVLLSPPSLPSSSSPSRRSPPLQSTPTLRDTEAPNAIAVAPRQATTGPGGFIAIPTTYGGLNSSPSPGTIVGIVLGSVGGFLFLLFMLYACLGIGLYPFAFLRGRGVVETDVEEVDEDIEVRRGRSSSKRKHRRRPRTTETYEVRTREHIVRDEPPIVVEPRRPPPPSAGPPPRVVPRDDEESEDEVIVFEEEEEERPRRKARRSSSRRSDERSRRASGYRPVDPDRYGGGDASYRDVRRTSGSRRDRDR